MYNEWLSEVAFAYKRLPGELLHIPWTHFLLMALPLQKHRSDEALWSALASHAPERLSKIREECQDGEEIEEDFEANFQRLKALAAKSGVLL